MEIPSYVSWELTPERHEDVEAELRWLEIEERIAECQDMAADASDAFVWLDGSLRLQVQPNGPIRCYDDDELDADSVRFITDDFAAYGASMVLKRDGQVQPPAMLASSGRRPGVHIVRYQFNPFEHNVRAWRDQNLAEPRRPAPSIRLLTPGNVLKLLIY